MSQNALSPKPDSLSIIIPTLNEESLIESCLQKIPVSSNLEIIIADGGSQDQTIQLAKTFDLVRIIPGKKGRAQQMNNGASAAKGSILLFLHADCLLPDNFLQEILDLLSTPGTIGGAFSFKTDYYNPLMRFIAIMVNIRSKLLSLPYGDQGIFVKTETFKELGGFPEVPVMEDFKMMGLLKKKGKIKISKQSILVSGRKWRQYGILKTTFFHQVIIIGTALGISPRILNRLFKPENQ